MAMRRRTTKEKVQDLADATVQKAQDFASTTSEVPAIFYDLLRNKAQAMGHAVANLPDDVWNKYARMDYKHDLLKQSKIYIENYMLGDLTPSKFAQIMAENDNLRYTISDICRVKLEPMDLDIEHNGKYVDIGAGIKTFWTEIRVPLPSEIETARDLRNIYFGIEAGRATAGVESKHVEENVSENTSKKKSFLERISDSRKVLAQKAIDKLTPIAEGKEDDTTSKETIADESLLDKLRNMGVDPESAVIAYNSVMQRQAAQNLENLTMAVEASKDENLHPDQRVNALTSTGISEEDAKNLVAGESSNNVTKQVKEYESQSEQNTDELFSEEDAVVAGIYDEKPATKMTASQPYHEPLRSGYSANELNCPINDELKDLFDQISAHVNHDKAVQRKSYNQKQDTKQAQSSKQEQNIRQEQINDTGKEKRLRKDYVSGEFEGKQVRFKGNWSNHKFTDEEVSKLLAGESISFTYVNSDKEEKDVSGKLEWQIYDGREFLGFKANFGKKEKVAETSKQLDSIEFQPSIDELNQLFGDVPDISADMAAYEAMKASGEISNELISESDDNDEVCLTEFDLPIFDNVQQLVQ